MIFLGFSTKGGAGKSTLVTNLTVMRSKNRKVLLIDGDEQQSSVDFTNHRISLNIPTPWTAITLKGNAIRTEVPKLKKDYDDIIIDCGGRDTASARAALLIADICVIPFQPKSFDIWTAHKVNELLCEAKSFNENLRAYTFINCASSRGDENEQAQKILKEFDQFQLLPVTLGCRKAFAHGIASGMSVIELKKDEKAIKEIKSLYNILFKERV